MKDWTGEEFMPGDILLAVAIKQDKQTVPTMIVENDGTLREAIATLSMGPEYVWMPFFEAEIVEINGELRAVAYSQTDQKKFAFTMEMIEGSKAHFVHFCKKGWNDSEEVFFKNYFQPNLN